MPRRMSRITQDEVARIIRAAQSCGLSIGGVAFDGDSVKVLTNSEDSGEEPQDGIDGPIDPESFQSFDDYLAWRDGDGARGH